MEFELKKCEGCGQMVPDYTLDRFNECGACRAEERAHDMTVGDLASR